ncbi:MAG: DUF1295 domain-containing protein [Pseudomonadota bacterium]|nr:DUF1295 domain-containing protein [Pseudomonadota bacterium]
MSSLQSLLGIWVCLCICLLWAMLGFNMQNSQYLSPFFYLGCVSFGIHLLGFLPSYVYATEHYFDLTGAIAHVSMVLVAWAIQPPLNIGAWIGGCCVLLWATRLGLFLFMRVKRDHKDDRFSKIKHRFWWFLMTWVISATWVFVTQGPILLAILNGAFNNSWWQVVGGVIWSLGFILEVVSDEQKRRFKRSQSRSRTPFICSGLWAYSRHPNYLGEITLWIGLAVYSVPSLLTWQYPVLISPCLVALLLIKVSGINMLEVKAEKKWGQRKDWERYKQDTALLIPWVW